MATGEVKIGFHGFVVRRVANLLTVIHPLYGKPKQLSKYTGLLRKLEEALLFAHGVTIPTEHVDEVVNGLKNSQAFATENGMTKIAKMLEDVIAAIQQPVEETTAH